MAKDDALRQKLRAHAVSIDAASQLSGATLEKPCAVWDEETRLVGDGTRPGDGARPHETCVLPAPGLDRAKQESKHPLLYGNTFGRTFDDDEMEERYEQLASISEAWVMLSHFGPEVRFAAEAQKATGRPVTCRDAGQALRWAYGTLRQKKAGGTAMPFSMDPLAQLADDVQEHTSEEDCRSQTGVWGLLVRALFCKLQDSGVFDKLLQAP